jgi:phosphatidylserine/phosphatidylglycerophosphate/cardiolipin synthase-like enzyme
VEYLDNVLASAQSTVLIASAFLSIPALERLRGPLAEAVSRGVTAYLLWGYGAGDERETKDAVEWVRKFRHQASARDRVLVNVDESGSHAKLLIWDSADGFEAAVGSRNWLSAKASPEHLTRRDASEVSLVVRGPGVVGALSRCAAALWYGSAGGPLSAAASHWRRIAADLEEASYLAKTDSDAESKSARLVIDGAHEARLIDYIGEARKRLLVASHQIGPIALRRLIGVARGAQVEGRSVRVVFGESFLDPTTLEELTTTLSSAGATVARAVGMHAKCALSDDNVVIGSYNYLSADPRGAAQRQREVSIEVQSAELSDALWAGFEREEREGAG